MSPASRFPPPSLPDGDPFPASARLSSYVPLPSREQTLAYVTAKLVECPGVVELSGPAGVGKSLLMRVAAKRLGDRFHPIHVPIPTLVPEEFARWIRDHGRRGRWQPARVARELWQRFRAGTRPLLLLVDDAQELSSETAAWIEQWCTEHGARAILAFTEESGVRRSTARRAFLEPLELGEVADYVERHLEQAGSSPEVRRLFEGEAVHTLALGSRGVPRAIHRIADQRLLALAALGAPEPEPAPRAERAPAPQARSSRSRRRRSRGSFVAGVAGALFLTPLTLSVPSRLADGPERPAAISPLPQPATSPETGPRDEFRPRHLEVAARQSRGGTAAQAAPLPRPQRER